MKAARGSEEWWRDYLVNGHRLEGMARFLFPRLPSSPRCKVCHAPFKGFGKLMRPFGWSPSLKNPNICGFCSDRLPAGGAEIQVAVIVADVRGYTQLSETMPPQELAALMSEFFQLATTTFTNHGALIDKYMGDAIQVLFIPGVAGPNFMRHALDAAVELRDKLALGTANVRALPIGIAVHGGDAFVGNVGGGGVVDLTAMGSVVNVVNRIQGEAKPGEVLVSDCVVSLLGLQAKVSRELDLKGVTDVTKVWVF